MTALKCLRGILVFIALFHLTAGIGLMFSVSFQKLAVASYGAALPWEVRDIYFVRIIGSFAFVLGYLAAMAAVDPSSTRSSSSDSSSSSFFATSIATCIHRNSIRDSACLRSSMI